MSHAYVSMMVHSVFCTKDRLPLLTPELRARLFPYMCGVAREHDFRILGINGIEDHVHALLALSSTMSIAAAVKFLKGCSSKWVHDTFPECHDFGWREGYSAFSIGITAKDQTLRYIARQQEHHAAETFDAEHEIMLKKHSMAHH